MLPGHNAKTNIGVFLGLVAGAVIFYEPFGALPAIFTYLIAGIGLLFHAWGCYNYVTGKGKSPVLTLIGVVPLGFFMSGVIPGYHPPAFCIVLIPIGLLILVLLPDSTTNLGSDRNRSGKGRFDREERKGSSMGGGMAVIVMLALALGGWYLYRQNSSVTVEEARKLALQRYPELGMRDSPLNKEFVARYNRLQTTNQDYFKDTRWPLKLATESQAALDQAQAKQ